LDKKVGNVALFLFNYLTHILTLKSNTTFSIFLFYSIQLCICGFFFKKKKKKKFAFAFVGPIFVHICKVEWSLTKKKKN
jgi:hypothetical protein